MRCRMMRVTALSVMMLGAPAPASLAQAEDPMPRAPRGTLANPGFAGQPIKSAFFFAGGARDGGQAYEFPVSSNLSLFTLHPSDARHLAWSKSADHQAFAVETMIRAGVNVINMSSWGERGLDRWTRYAPMQTSTYAHDELFRSAAGRPVLIIPYIESTPEWRFLDEFPGQPAEPAPGLVSQIKDLVSRYLLEPDDPAWSGRWAQVFDRRGAPRYAVAVIHAASNQPGMTGRAFADGLGRVAERIHRETGILVGFLLDVLPAGTHAPGAFKATPEEAGEWLAREPAVLAIQCYNPEVWLGTSDEPHLLAWKERWLSSWIGTGIPVIHDVVPGYDARVVFPRSPVYGNNAAWRSATAAMVSRLGAAGMTFNAWNGYTEGYAGVPTLEHGADDFKWAAALFSLHSVSGTPSRWGSEAHGE